MSEPVVGLRPWLPWPLARWRWWTEPVPAERLAALRTGVGGVLLLDLLFTYWPCFGDLFGTGSLGDPDAFPVVGWRWSLLRGVGDRRLLTAALLLWTAASVGLILGFWTRLSAAAAWLLAVSFGHVNPAITSAGDEVRSILLFYLMLSPCGAAWSLDSRRSGTGRVLVWPWALRLLFVQMVLIYFVNGVCKLIGSQWRSGDSVYYVLADLTLTRWSPLDMSIPHGLTQGLTWCVLAWEVSFPLLVTLHRTRTPALAFGVLFHIGIGIALELGMFAPYMLCLYLPLVPWERMRSASGPLLPAGGILHPRSRP
jgi:hypothetical protein